MNSFQFPEFEINPISEKDGWRLCDFISANADDITRYFPKTVESNLNPTLSNLFVLEKMSDFLLGKEYLFTLKEPEHRKIIGLIYLKELKREAKEAEIAYCIGYTHQNQGFASKAVKTISEWGFNEQGLNRLRIIAHKTNLSSIKVAENCDYIWEETLLKEHTPPNEDPLDMELYVLQNER
ncbi:GNAT family N-acetyltransferase [Maribacter hydrothermalis]|uniref:GNAT family acetyltransferase n=1 Tax=Maribacter hydrothermalis TaxID=1836467 RepID=A0A1B7ZEH1_9FLAO|nr:GNAT family protein [Maribacter hydrothermalis]APQ17479.1 GNAT family N-acetyltransferase [Maribacter hydrothermalis]OBR41956.1 GNAT family acetyltransferase [Maribacter hydrothermalis]